MSVSAATDPRLPWRGGSTASISISPIRRSSWIRTATKPATTPSASATHTRRWSSAASTSSTSSCCFAPIGLQGVVDLGTKRLTNRDVDRGPSGSERSTTAWVSEASNGRIRTCRMLPDHAQRGEQISADLARRRVMTGRRPERRSSCSHGRRRDASGTKMLSAFARSPPRAFVRPEATATNNAAASKGTCAPSLRSQACRCHSPAATPACSPAVIVPYGYP